MTRSQVPMVDLKAQYARIKAEVDAAVAGVLESAHFIKGEDCALFEREFAAYCGAAHAVGVANGTDALVIALRAYGVGPGDEIVTVANTFIATGEAIFLNGARPVFVDVDPVSFTMDPAQVEKAITPRTKVILPVHLYGHPADMTPINAVAARHGIPVLEDAAQAHGAENEGRRTGTLGHAACFSFYPGKNLGAYGDAGAVVTSDREFAARVRQIANHGGGANKYDNVVVGMNSRLDTLQAAILRVKLRHLERWDAERVERVRAYTEALADVPGVIVPRERAGARSAWHLYTVARHRPRRAAEHLAAQAIGTAVHYPRPIHLQPAMAAAGGRPGDLPVSERLSAKSSPAPVSGASAETVGRIAGLIRSFREAAAVRG